MTDVVDPQDLDIIHKFGGGIHTRASEEDINEREGSDGTINCELDPLNREMRPRRPFQLIDTAPNEARINGMINLIKTDGTSAVLVQAGGNLYEYNGAGTGFSSSPVATVSTAARLRGRFEHNWPIEDKVIITDLALQENVAEWDGTTYQDVTFSPSGTTLKAKYCQVAGERAYYANVESNATATPHIFVGSALSDYTTISINDRPSSAIGFDDPFFIASPDLRPINGFVDDFGQPIISTEDGGLFYLGGSDATDYQILDFFPRAFASGDEAMVALGNLLLYGRRGRIELLRDTDRFADTEANDLSLVIGDQVETYKDWTVVYNKRTQRAYCFPADASEVWVFHLPMLGTGLSPWMKYITSNDFAFQPTATMNMIDPDDGLEYTYMGDASGNFYRMEGPRGSGDAGSDEVRSVFVSNLKTFPRDVQGLDYSGYVKYRKGEPYTINLTFQYSGQTALDETRNIIVPQINASYFNNEEYFNDGVYFGAAFSDRLIRQKYAQPGQAEDFQIKTEVTTTSDFRINEVGIAFEITKP